MSFLIDTDVLSALRRPDRNASVRAWLEANADQEMFLSVITIGEIRRGIELKRSRDARGALALETWLDELKLAYRHHILAVDTEIAETWGRLTSAKPQHATDALIAATALVRELTVVTRNRRHFAGFPVPVIDPF